MMIGSEVAKDLYALIRESVFDQRLSETEKIPNYRTVLEDLFNEITSGDQHHFSGLFSRISFVFETSTIPYPLQRSVHSLRMLANDILHQRYRPSDSETWGAVKSICEAVAYFSGIEVSEDLLNEYSNRNTSLYSREKKDSKEDYIPFIRVVVLAPGETKTIFDKKGGKRELCNLFCDAGEQGKIIITFWQPFSNLGLIAKKYSEINIFNLKKTEHGDRVNYSTVFDRSLVVLDPDILLDATEIRACFQFRNINPLIWLVNRFFRTDKNSPIILGNLVNGIFDNFLSQRSFDFNQTWDHIYQENLFDLLFLTRDELTDLKHQVIQHFATIRKFYSKKHDNIYLEPTYISPWYGLSGRLDLIFAYSEEPHRKDILELKSGKQKHGGVWPQDKAQAVCYDLLLDSASGFNRIGKTYIFYSRDKDGPKREVVSRFQDKLQILDLRNSLVAIGRELADNNHEIFENFSQASLDSLPEFIKEKLKQLEIGLSRADPLAKCYFYQFVSFVFREEWFARIGGRTTSHKKLGYAALWQCSLEEKKNNYRILSHLKIDKSFARARLKRLKLIRTEETPHISDFKKGDIAVLTCHRPNEPYDPASGQLIKCVITDIDPKTVFITLRNPLINTDYFQNDYTWILEHDQMYRGYINCLSSLFDLICSAQEKKDLILGVRQPKFRKDIKISSEKSLGIIQQDLVEKALKAEDYFILMGPPGTGKTSIMLSEIVRHIYRNSTENILLLAFTNQAVDEICRCLENITRYFIRLGNRESTDYSEYLLSTILEEMGKDGREAVIEKINVTRIFVSTVASIQANDTIIQLKKFSTVIIDEASQLLEPSLVGLLSKIKRFILIGDHKQLPAVVLQPESNSIVKDGLLKKAGFNSLAESFFDRLLNQCKINNWHNAFGMLTRQGRMHDQIASFPSKYFYDGKLEPLAARNWQSQQKTIFKLNSKNRFEKIVSRSRMIFIPSNIDPRSQQNLEEAETIVGLLEMIYEVYKDNFNPDTVGVITPFRRQIAAIHNILPKKIKKIVTVDTVERFQGSEREIIIISFAVKHANQLKNLQVLSHDGSVDRKLNVSLTRARKQLILTGVPEVLSRGKFYPELIEHIKSQDGYITEF